MEYYPRFQPGRSNACALRLILQGDYKLFVPRLREGRSFPQGLMIRLLRLLVCGFLLFTIQPGQALVFDKVIVFSGGDQVRIEAALKSTEDLNGVELSGVITHAKTGHELWQGDIGRTNITSAGAAVISHTVSGLKPDLWSPASPALYKLSVTARKG